MNNDYVSTNEKQREYEIDRHSKMIHHGINQAMHSITNVSILSHNGFWPDDKHLWDNVRDDALKILGNITQLKEKLDSLLGPSKEEEEE
jgi:hypothetical protein